MSSEQIVLRPVTRGPLPCKICQGAADLYGVVDLHRPCLVPGTARPPLSGVPVYYRRCGTCGFLFTDAFDDWSHEQFKAHIYNDGYGAFDPEYQTIRPNNNAKVVGDLWNPHKAKTRVLDFGGGNDVFCTALRQRGFAAAVTYDPMVPEHATRPKGKFDLVTCFETVEHLPDPIEGMGRMIECAADPGMIFYSTLVQPADFDQQGLSWWYVGPRNGHVSMFTKQALAAAWARHGYQNTSLNDNTHVAYRTLPPGWRLNG
jgi:2-polyprenyl-6-hydroxyphenyl methylase/3-demethylubiquinone-9 3-methyltransferase